MKPVESFGKLTDLYEDINGDRGQIVYLKDANEEALVKRYNDIKSAKQIISAYGMNGRHYLVIAVGGIIKKKVIRTNKKVVRKTTQEK